MIPVYALLVNYWFSTIPAIERYQRTNVSAHYIADKRVIPTTSLFDKLGPFMI